MGVFENVEVLGRSGADLETELLHHETTPREEGSINAPTAPTASATHRETTTDEAGGETTPDPGTAPLS
jgi:hypothetical protein